MPDGWWGGHVRDLSTGALLVKDVGGGGGGGGITVPQTFGGRAWTAGRWYATQGASTQTAIAANDTLIVTPIFVPVGQTFDSLNFQVSTAGEAGSLIDALLYADLASYPGAVLQSWAAIAGSPAAAKQCDLSPSITSTSGIYWFGCRFYNSPTTRPTVRSAPAPELGLSVTGANPNGILGSANGGYSISTAVNLDPFPTNTTALPGVIGVRVAVRAA